MTRPGWWRNLKPEAIWGTTRLVNEVPGLRVTSGWRSRAENKRVKGVPNSAHLTGWATDLVGSRVAMQRGANLARQIGCRQVLIHDVGSGLHLHVDWRAR